MGLRFYEGKSENTQAVSCLQKGATTDEEKNFVAAWTERLARLEKKRPPSRTACMKAMVSLDKDKRRPALEKLLQAADIIAINGGNPDVAVMAFRTTEATWKV